MTPVRARVRTVLGWFTLTPIEWTFLVGIVGFSIWAVVPRYLDWQSRALVEEELFDAGRVVAALNNDEGTAVRCPPYLDECPDGATSEECSLFTTLGPEALPTGQWIKKSGDYIGPAGGRYRYLPRECWFGAAFGPGQLRIRGQ
jgi:hypothetical protein